MCDVNELENTAAQQLLALSEADVQQMKQRGRHKTTRSDRFVMSLPDYKAIRAPELTAPELGVSYTYNNMATPPYGSETYSAPYEAGKSREGLSYAKLPERGPPLSGPGASHAPVYTDASLYAASFAQDQDDAVPLYKSIASSLTAFPEQADAEIPVPPLARPPEVPRARSQRHYLSPNLYGDANCAGGAWQDLGKCTWNSLRAAVYDGVNSNQITPEVLQDAGHTNKASFIFTRDGRGPYLGLILLLLCFAVFFLAWLLSSGKAKPPKYAYISGPPVVPGPG